MAVYRPVIAHATGASPTGGSVKLTNPISSRTLNDVAAKAIKTVLGIVGALSLVAFVYGGVVWLTSAGNPERVQTGTRAMLYAAIGIIVIFTSFAILSTVFRGFSGG